MRALCLCGGGGGDRPLDFHVGQGSIQCLSDAETVSPVVAFSELDWAIGLVSHRGIKYALGALLSSAVKTLSLPLPLPTLATTPVLKMPSTVIDSSAEAQTKVGDSSLWSSGPPGGAIAYCTVSHTSSGEAQVGEPSLWSSGPPGGAIAYCTVSRDAPGACITYCTIA